MMKVFITQSVVYLINVCNICFSVFHFGLRMLRINFLFKLKEVKALPKRYILTSKKIVCYCVWIMR